MTAWRSINHYRDRPIGAALGLLMVSWTAAIVLSETAVRPLLWNTISLSAATAVICMPLGVTWGLLLGRTNLVGRRLTVWLLLMMLLIPAYLQVAGWEAGFGLQGWFSRWMGWPSEPLLTGWRGAILLHSIVSFPWVVLISTIGLAALPSQVEQQALLDGTNAQVLWRVTMPHLRPSLCAALLWVWVLATCEITITDVYQIRTFAEEVYTGFALGDTLSEAPQRVAPGIILTAGTALAALVICAQFVPQLAAARRLGAWQIDIGRWRWPLGMLVLFCTLLVVAIPIINLVYQAGLHVTLMNDRRVREWSFTRVAIILADTPVAFLPELGWSLLLGQITALTGMLTALCLSTLGRTRAWVRGVAWSGAMLGLAVPGPILALGLSRMVNQPQVEVMRYLCDRTLFVAWLALSIRLFPIAFLLCDTAVRQLDPRLREIAIVEGAGWWRAQWHGVIRPLGDILGWLWLLLLALAIGDLSVTILAVPPGVTTISIRVFNLVHYGVADQLAGLCLMTLAIFGLLAALVIAMVPTNPSTERARV
jgi:iron(III) transport system permease protein